jgi:hypothetical protein
LVLTRTRTFNPRIFEALRRSSVRPRSGRSSFGPGRSRHCNGEQCDRSNPDCLNRLQFAACRDAAPQASRKPNRTPHVTSMRQAVPSTSRRAPCRAWMARKAGITPQGGHEADKLPAQKRILRDVPARSILPLQILIGCINVNRFADRHGLRRIKPATAEPAKPIGCRA